MSGAAELVLPGVVKWVPVVGQHRVHLVGHGGDEAAQEVCGSAARDLFVQFDKGELGGAVDRHQQVELALRGAHFGDVNVKLEHFQNESR